MYKMKKSQSYQDLEIYQLAKQLAVTLHRITVNKLPKFEMYEEGSQIRRSSKSIVSNIVEGFGRRRYKNEFILYLTYAIASCDETKSHIDILRETGLLKGKDADELFTNYEELGAKLYKSKEAVIKSHRTTCILHLASCVITPFSQSAPPYKNPGPRQTRSP